MLLPSILALAAFSNATTTITNSVSLPRPGSETLVPVLEQILLGTFNSGGNLASWSADDGNLRQICKFFIPNAAYLMVNLTFRATKLNPIDIKFRVRIENATTGRQIMTLRLQDAITNQFNDTDVKDAAITKQTTYLATPPGPFSRFVRANGNVVAQLEIKTQGMRAVAFPCVSFDSANLIVTD